MILRDFYSKLRLLLLSMVLLLICSCASDTPNKEERSNILVIMTDDQAQWACSVYGNQEVQTPHLDWLAENGLTFENAYTITAVCSPSRASFFTGRIPSQHGVHDVLSENPDFDHNWLEKEVFLPEILQDAGYTTGLIGKWHSTTDCLPVHRGWDRWFTYNVHVEGWQNQYLHEGPTHFSDQGEAVTLEGYQSENLTREALKFLQHQEAKKPFFLFLGYVDTHAPFSGLPERLVAPYREARFDAIPQGESSYLPLRNDYSHIPDNHREQLAQYYAGVQFMDEQLGILLEALRSSGALDNTLLIFTSDHGHMNGHHGLYGKANATTPQNFYQESILVPLLMHWPKGIKKKKERLAIPVNQCDLFQTVLDAASANLTKEERAQINSPGKSIWTYVEKTTTAWSDYKFAEYGNARMIADERYKLIVRYAPLKPGFEAEFFDLKTDPRESANQIADPSYQDQIQEMRTVLDQYFSRYETAEHSITRLLEQEKPNAVPVWLR